MVESLTAVCHHLGQPATVISTCMALMSRQDLSPEKQSLVKEGADAAELLGGLLHKFNDLVTYRTEYAEEVSEPSRMLSIS